ncbi:hypothetical protein BYT27DRAFT_7246944 [Phlegmacium glaucopus]|nr:hypothetical protein BYT27DRAFT_7246944 [Phlegmacium glaucopus]
MYLQGTSKKGIDKKTSILFYAICALYALSCAIVLLDITWFINGTNPTASLHLAFIQGAVSGCCDFIAQFILIYRCWIVWGCNIPVVILPSVLAFVFLVIWLAGNGSQIILSGQLVQPHWAQGMIVAAVAVSMTVNALILKMYHEVKSALGSDDQGLGATGGSKIYVSPLHADLEEIIHLMRDRPSAYTRVLYYINNFFIRHHVHVPDHVSTTTIFLATDFK